MIELILRTASLFMLSAIAFSMNARTYLVSVGIADYSGYPAKTENLSLTAKDAQTIANLYAANTPVDYSLLIDADATHDKILKSITKVFDMASEDDIVVFFFSGHGYAGGICSYDGIVSYKEIRKAMSQSKSKNKMMFVDACKSGGIRVDKTVEASDTTEARKANVLLFLSSRTDESSLERASMQNGFFTTYLKQGLQGEADANGDKTITAKELFMFVSQGVRELSNDKQHPVMWGNFSHDMPVMAW